MIYILTVHASFISTLTLHQDADSDTRVVRRIRRDTVERGRTLDSYVKEITDRKQSQLLSNAGDYQSSFFFLPLFDSCYCVVIEL